jgi:anaerobic ribonucleoside-triphosphate reductase activating protein
MDTDEILAQFRENPLLAGITLSGGEPFLQAGILAPLAREIRKLGKNVITYTGFIFEEIPFRMSSATDAAELLSATDILIDGPYREELRDPELLFRGSSNQRVLELQNGTVVRDISR